MREDHAGAYNIVGDGTLNHSDVLKLGGRLPLPVPHVLGYPIGDALFNLQIADAPGTFLNYLRYPWVADGKRMRDEMGFQPRWSSRDALIGLLRLALDPRPAPTDRPSAGSQLMATVSPDSRPADYGDHHRDPQMDQFADAIQVDADVFESRSDTLSLDSLREALEQLGEAPGVRDVVRVVRRFGIARLQTLMTRLFASREIREIDEFGFDPSFLEPLEPLAQWLHDHYFRVESDGLEHVPSEGRVLMVANHSGTLPYDGAMVVTAVRFSSTRPSARFGRWSKTSCTTCRTWAS